MFKKFTSLITTLALFLFCFNNTLQKEEEAQISNAENETVSVFVTINDNYVPFAYVALNSMFQHAEGTKYNVYALMPKGSLRKRELKELETVYPENKVQPIDMPEDFQRTCDEWARPEIEEVKKIKKLKDEGEWGGDVPSCFPGVAYYRLFAPEVFDGNHGTAKLNRIVYMDVDTVVLHSLSPLNHEVFSDDIYIKAGPDNLALYWLKNDRRPAANVWGPQGESRSGVELAKELDRNMGGWACPREVIDLRDKDGNPIDRNNLSEVVKNYINSGVILFDLEKCREKDVCGLKKDPKRFGDNFVKETDGFIQFMNTHNGDVAKRLSNPDFLAHASDSPHDQNVFNAVLGPRHIEWLHPRFNTLGTFDVTKSESDSQSAQLFSRNSKYATWWEDISSHELNSVITHYPNQKPWVKTGVYRGGLWWEAALATPYFDGGRFDRLSFDIYNGYLKDQGVADSDQATGERQPIPDEQVGVNLTQNQRNFFDAFFAQNFPSLFKIFAEDVFYDPVQCEFGRNEQSEKIFTEKVSALNGNSYRLFSFDVGVYKEDSEEKPDLKPDAKGVKVQIPLPKEFQSKSYAQQIEVYTADDQGNVSQLEVEVKQVENPDNPGEQVWCVVFIAPHFSPYLFAFNGAKANWLLRNMMWLWLLLAVALLLLITFIIIKKKRTKNEKSEA